MAYNDVFVLKGMINAKEFGAKGDYNPGTGSGTDDTAALAAAYSAAASAGAILFIPPGTYKFTSQLLWDSAVNVIGANRQATTLYKVGNFVAIKIDGAGGYQTYSDFTLAAADRTTNTGDGIDLWTGDRVILQRVTVQSMGGHGIRLRSGNLATFRDIVSLLNAGDGFLVDSLTGTSARSANACNFHNIDVRVNTGIGFNINKGDSHFCESIIAQTNNQAASPAIGVRVNDFGNYLKIYAESDNTIALTANAVECEVVTVSGGTVVSDLGKNNTLLSLRSSVQVAAGGTNQDVTIRPSGSGRVIVRGYEPLASGSTPGVLLLKSDNTAVAGGETIGSLEMHSSDPSSGGEGLCTAVRAIATNAFTGATRATSLTFITTNGTTSSERMRVTATGEVVIGSTTFDASAILQAASTTQGFLPPRMTTTQRNAISSPAAGLIIYNTSTNKLNVFTGSAWEQVTSA